MPVLQPDVIRNVMFRNAVAALYLPSFASSLLPFSALCSLSLLFSAFHFHASSRFSALLNYYRGNKLRSASR